MKLCRFDDDRLGRVQADNVLDVTPALAQISVQRWPIAQGDPLALYLERVMTALTALLPKAPRRPPGAQTRPVLLARV